MKYFTSVTILLVFMQTINGEDNSTKAINNETVHIFLLMVRDSDLNQVRRQLLRQEDEDGGGGTAGSFAETGQYLGQIIQGVLGGDLRPVFAGSVKFVEEPSAQQNLGSFLGTIAPTLNLVLRDFYTRAQVAFGFATTPKPTTVSPTPPIIEYETEDQFNNTLIGSNGTYIYDYDANFTLTVTVGPQQKQPPQVQRQPQQVQRQPQQVQRQPQRVQQQSQPISVQNHLPPPAPTTAWQYVLTQINSDTTTVEPLPLIRRPTRAPIPEEGDDDDDVKI